MVKGMSSKTYEQKVARLVQEACDFKYTTALKIVLEHKVRVSEKLSVEERALRIMNEYRVGEEE
jgi:hypothetical protein